MTITCKKTTVETVGDKAKTVTLETTVQLPDDSLTASDGAELKKVIGEMFEGMKN